MKKIFSLSVLLLAAMLLFVACGDSGTASEVEAANTDEVEAVDNESDLEDGEESSELDRADWPEVIRFAVTGLEGMEELQRNHEPFRLLLEEKMGVEFEFFALSSRIVSATAMQFDQVDIILAGPSEYVQIKYETPEVEILAAMERLHYHTAFIVPMDSPLQSLEDLVGGTIGMGSIGSTSRHIGPSAVLIEEGFDLDSDFTIHNLGTSGSIEALRNGEVDAIAGGIRDFWTMEEEDGEGVWRILLEGPQLPQDPFVANPNLPESFRAEFSRILLTYSDELLASMLSAEGDDVTKYEGAEIVMVDDSYFESLREAYRVLGLEL